MAPLSTRLPSSVIGLLLLALLALPFALIGSGLAYRAAWTVVSAKSMQSWPTVPATLLHVEMQRPGSRSERVVASYSYLVGGQAFSGKMVSLYGPDNLGDFHKKAYGELQGYLSRGEPYAAHVNPRAPGESILMPVVRWEALAFSLTFVVLFGGAGWGLLIASFRKAQRMRVEARLVAQYPDQPWRHRVDWSTGRIRSDQKATAFGAVGLAIMWNACTWPMLFAVPARLQAGESLGLLLLVFPLIGLGLVYWAGVSIVRARRFGNTFLELETFPGRQGESFRGRITAPAALEACPEVLLTLSCEKRARAREELSTSRTRSLWKQEVTSKVLGLQSSTGDAIIKVEFELPADLEDTSYGPGDGITWQLVAFAEMDGADFEAEFEVPVFRH